MNHSFFFYDSNKYTTHARNEFNFYFTAKLYKLWCKLYCQVGKILNLCRTAHPLVIPCLQPRLISLDYIIVQKMACRYRMLILISLKVRCAQVPWCIRDSPMATSQNLESSRLVSCDQFFAY